MSIDNGSDSSATIISLDWPDEAFVLFLSNFRNGDSLPLNVIADKDPFIIEPSATPAGTWYLWYNEDYGCPERQKVRIMGGGYWKEIENDIQISWDILGEGRKVFWEFYKGHGPSGDRTGWQMLEYHIERKEVCEADGIQDFNSLCRIYLKESDRPVLGDASHSNADQNTVDSTFLGTQLQVPSREETETMLGTGRSEIESDPDDTYSSADFLELKDFVDDRGSVSSSSDDSSNSSESSDRYFDHVALCKELENDNISTESREVSTCHSPGVNKVSAEAPPAAYSQGTGYRLLEEGVPCGSAPADRCRAGKSTASSSRYPPSNKLGPSRMGILKRAASRRSESSGSSHASRGSLPDGSSSHGSGSSVEMIKKFGKKYLCFNSF